MENATQLTLIMSKHFHGHFYRLLQKNRKEAFLFQSTFSLLLLFEPFFYRFLQQRYIAMKIFDAIKCKEKSHG